MVLRILLLEDVAADAELVSRALRQAGIECELERAGTREAFLAALDTFAPDIVLADYSLPGFDGAAALDILSRREPAVPAIIVTGALGDEKAVELLKAGARDYVLKDRLARLAPAVRRTLDDAAARRERQLAQARLAASEQEARQRLEEITAINAELAEVNRTLGQYEAQLLQAEKMAAIGTLAAGVAHEINNPVGYVKSNLESLRGYVDHFVALIGAVQAEIQAHPGNRAFDGLRALGDAATLAYEVDDVHTLLAESTEGLQRITRIVRNLEDFSRPYGSGTWCAEDIHKCIDSTLMVVSDALEGKCQVVRDYGRLPPVECRIAEINQVFLNLLLNAAQAIQDKGTVTIRTGAEGDRIFVDVGDDGPGIPAEHLHRIFDPFFTTRPVGRGTGLGLSLCHGILMKHRGGIEVESEPGRGTTFHVWLPIRQPPNAPA